MSRIRFICIASIARTGTSQLRRLLSVFPDIAPYGEVFHPRRANTLSRDDIAAFGVATGLSFSGETRDPGLVAAAGAMPDRLLDVLAERSSKPITAFKLFPSHLRRSDTARILARDDTLVALLTRRPLDSYISLHKARITGSFQGIDTSAMQIDCEAGHFRRWFTKRDNWFRFVRQIADSAGTPIVPLSYETDIAVDPSQAVMRIGRALADAGLSLGPAGPPSLKPLVQQDNATQYDRKMRNWPGFKETLQEEGLYDLALSRFPGGAA